MKSQNEILKELLLPFFGPTVSVSIEENTPNNFFPEVMMWNFQLKTVLPDGVIKITGEERIALLKEQKSAAFWCFGLNAFMYFWKNQQHIPVEAKEEINEKPKILLFDGIIFRLNDQRRYVLGLVWGNKKWHYYCSPLDGEYGSNFYSAVFEKKNKKVMPQEQEKRVLVY